MCRYIKGHRLYGCTPSILKTRTSDQYTWSLYHMHGQALHPFVQMPKPALDGTVHINQGGVLWSFQLTFQWSAWCDEEGRQQDANAGCTPVFIFRRFLGVQSFKCVIRPINMDFQLCWQKWPFAYTFAVIFGSNLTIKACFKPFSHERLVWKSYPAWIPSALAILTFLATTCHPH